MELRTKQLKLFYVVDSELNDCGSSRPEETTDDDPQTSLQEEMKVEVYSYYSDGTSQSDFGGKIVER